MRHCLLFFALLSSESVYSQACGSLAGTSTPNTSSNQSKYWVNVYYHIVRTSAHTGGYPSGQLCDVTTKLNQDYNQYGIYFNTTGFDYIDNDNFYNTGALNSPIGTNTVNNVINIYLVNSYSDQANHNYTGCAQNIPSTALWVVNQYVLDGTLSHEVGHCLGLYHTHRGSPFGPDSETGGNACMENISESNCSRCGDMICDTPASPNLLYSVDSNCNYTNPTGWNQNGAPYSPDTHNFMSYSPCRTRFSTQQVYAMKNTLAGSLANVVNNGLAFPLVNGPDNVCSSATLTCSDIVSGYSINSWTSSDQSIATLNSSGTLTRSGDGLITATATLSQGCTNYYAYKRVYVGLPVPLTGTYNYGIYTYPVNYPGNGISVSSSAPNIYINLSEADPSASFTWNTVSSSGYSAFWPGSNTATLYLQSGASRNVTCYATNVCGTGPTTNFNCYNYTTNYRMTSYPNPANENLSVTASQEITEQDDSGSSKDEMVLTTDDLSKVNVFLFNKDGKALLSGKFVDNKLQFNTQKIPNGTYYLHIGDEKNEIRLQFIIQH